MRLVAAMMIAAAAPAEAQTSLLQRPTEVTALLRNSPKLFDGTYRAQAVG